jgi:hypothetical protein
MYLLALAYAFLLGFSVPSLVSVWVLRKRRRSWDSVFAYSHVPTMPEANEERMRR